MLLPSSTKLLLFVALQCIVQTVAAENAWGIAGRKASVVDKEPSPAEPGLPCTCEQGVDAILYKKLVNYLFRKSKYVKDDLGGKHLINIHLQITEEQIEALQGATTSRDMDEIVFTVIENSKSGIVVEATEVILSWYDRLHYIYLCVIQSQVLLMILLIAGFITSVFVMRHWLALNLPTILILHAIVFSVFFKYLDCNRRLEYENLIKMKTLTSEPNPCEKTTKFLGLVSNYDARKCADYMISVHGHERRFCDPVEVISEFGMSFLVLKPIRMFMELIGEFVDGTVSKNGYIKGGILAVIVLVACNYLFGHFIETLSRIFGRILKRTPTATGSVAVTPSSPSIPVPLIVNVHIQQDRRACGDYIQQVILDEEKTRAAIEPPKSPTVERIESLENGLELEVSESMTSSEESFVDIVAGSEEECEAKKEK